MDSRMKRSLDSYIMGEHLTREEEVKHKCKSCGHTWVARMLYDMGGWFYLNDNDAFCPKCHKEYEES